MENCKFEKGKMLCECHNNLINSYVDTHQTNPLSIYLFLMAEGCLVKYSKQSDIYISACLVVYQNDDMLVLVDPLGSKVVALVEGEEIASVDMTLTSSLLIDSMCQKFSKIARREKDLHPYFENEDFYEIDILS